jgi:transcription antitermination protein NusB
LPQPANKAKRPNRHKARESALEVLYAWHNGGQDGAMVPSLLADRLRERKRADQDRDFVRELVLGVTSEADRIDEKIATAIGGRSLKSIAHVEHTVLRLAVWEMQHKLATPYRVIINEALELTRDYAGEAPRGFINGVLDNLAKVLRPEEAKPTRG